MTFLNVPKKPLHTTLSQNMSVVLCSSSNPCLIAHFPSNRGGIVRPWQPGKIGLISFEPLVAMLGSLWQCKICGSHTKRIWIQFIKHRSSRGKKDTLDTFRNGWIVRSGKLGFHSVRGSIRWKEQKVYFRRGPNLESLRKGNKYKVCMITGNAAWLNYMVSHSWSPIWFTNHFLSATTCEVHPTKPFKIVA